MITIRQKYFSNNEDFITPEERAFCEGYEYAQREFSNFQETARNFNRKLERNGKYLKTIGKSFANELFGTGKLSQDDKQRMSAVDRLMRYKVAQGKNLVNDISEKNPKIGKYIDYLKNKLDK